MRFKLHLKAIILIAGLMLCFVPHFGHAVEYPVFSPAPQALNINSMIPIKNYMNNVLAQENQDNKEFIQHALIANLDLNYDGVPEYIVKSCPPSKRDMPICDFRILAMVKNAVTPIGHFAGRTVRISDQADFGAFPRTSAADP